MNGQLRLCLDDTLSSVFLFVCLYVHWVEKLSSRGSLLQHLESSGTKTMMRGPIIRQFGWDEIEKQKRA